MWASYHRQQEAYLRRREEARVEEQQLAVKAMAAHDDTKRVRIGDRWMEGAYHVIGHQRVDAAGDGDSGKATAKTKSTPQKVGPASSTTTSSRTTVLAEDAPEVEELLERLVVLRRYHEKSTLNGVGKQQQSAADAARQHKETLLGEEPHVDTNASIDELFDNTMSLVFR